MHAGTLEAITDYLAAAGHGNDPTAPLFRPVRANATGSAMAAPLMPSGRIPHGEALWEASRHCRGERFGPHAARATAAINALDAGADIAKVQEWLGHANISITRVYDNRKTRPEDSPVFEVKYQSTIDAEPREPVRRMPGCKTTHA